MGEGKTFVYRLLELDPVKTTPDAPDVWIDRGTATSTSPTKARETYFEAHKDLEKAKLVAIADDAFQAASDNLSRQKREVEDIVSERASQRPPRTRAAAAPTVVQKSEEDDEGGDDDGEDGVGQQELAGAKAA